MPKIDEKDAVVRSHQERLYENCTKIGHDEATIRKPEKVTLKLEITSS